MRNKNTSHMKHVMILISNQEECEHLGLLGPLKRLIAWKCVRYVMYICRTCLFSDMILNHVCHHEKSYNTTFNIAVETDLLTVVHECFSLEPTFVVW